jgi:hypothetical protein
MCCPVLSIDLDELGELVHLFLLVLSVPIGPIERVLEADFHVKPVPQAFEKCFDVHGTLSLSDSCHA